jgi:Na+-translocating ferredoxin:NAD+ oxidoreductase subunit C
MFRRYGTFTGGIDLPEQKHATLEEPIRPADRPERLFVPLAPCGGLAARPVVDVGQRVRRGDPLAAGRDPGTVDIFAPLDGTVAAISVATLAVGRRLMETPAVELTDLSEPQVPAPGRPTRDTDDLAAGPLRELLDDSQLTTFRRCPEPLGDWLARHADSSLLVVNAMENEPYVTAGHRVLVEFGPEVVGGMAMLARALEVERIVLAIDVRRTDDYQHLLAPAEACEAEHVALPWKYPIGADAILLKVLTRREVPCGGAPADLGAAVIDPATCWAVYRHLACEERIDARVVTLSGERMGNPANILAPFGLAMTELVGSARPPLVLNGPMTGMFCGPETVVTPGTDCLLAIDPTPPSPPSQCIRCGWCRDHCPSRLNVAVLNDLYELGDIERAARIGCRSCVGCGVCSYVCPARLPLTERVRQLARSVSRLDQTMPLFHRGTELEVPSP